MEKFESAESNNTKSIKQLFLVIKDTSTAAKKALFWTKLVFVD